MDGRAQFSLANMGPLSRGGSSKLLRRLSLKTVKSSRDDLGFSTSTPDGIKAAWKIFDIDADGSISRDEFLAVLTRSTDGSGKHALTREQAEMLFDEADGDHSGSIDVDEFASAWADMNAQYGLQHMFPHRRMSRGATFMNSMASKLHLSKNKPPK